MSAQDEEKATPAAAGVAESANVATATAATDALTADERAEKLLKAKELYSHGSRNFLVKSYADAADELSQVCVLFAELHGELCDELGMPYLLYAKSLIALALDENKVIDVPDEEEDDDDDDDDDADTEDDETAAPAAQKNGEAAAASTATNGAAATASSKLIEKASAKADEADSTAGGGAVAAQSAERKAAAAEAQVSSTDDAANAKQKPQNGTAAKGSGSGAVASATPDDGEKPSTSNGDAETAEGAEEEEDNEAATNLQLAWEILELAAKIFSRQGLSGLPNLAEVQTELANIEFENSILDAAREDYEKALRIYTDLPINYRRAMAEIHYKIGLSYLMEQLNKEGAASLKEACSLIEGEIEEIKAKPELTDKDKNNIQDMEETKQEIWAKISEIEETQAQNIAEVRAAMDSYINPMGAQQRAAGGAGSSSSAAAASSTSGAKATAASSSSASSSSPSSSAAVTASKPTDISHLIKRKKPDEPSSAPEADAASPAKRPAI